jgi:hypothetical protein
MERTRINPAFIRVLFNLEGCRYGGSSDFIRIKIDDSPGSEGLRVEFFLNDASHVFVRHGNVYERMNLDPTFIRILREKVGKRRDEPFFMGLEILEIEDHYRWRVGILAGPGYGWDVFPRNSHRAPKRKRRRKTG